MVSAQSTVWCARIATLTILVRSFQLLQFVNFGGVYNTVWSALCSSKTPREGHRANESNGGLTLCLSRFRRPSFPGRYVTKFEPDEALKLIAWGKLTFDKRVVIHRVVSAPLFENASRGGHGK